MHPNSDIAITIDGVGVGTPKTMAKNRGCYPSVTPYLHYLLIYIRRYSIDAVL